jgi:hypothetical protein
MHKNVAERLLMRYHVSFHHRDTESQKQKNLRGRFSVGSVSLYWALSGKEHLVDG